MADRLAPPRPAAATASSNLVDDSDYALWAANYGATSLGNPAQGEAAPEPAGLLAISLLGAAIARRVRQR